MRTSSIGTSNLQIQGFQIELIQITHWFDQFTIQIDPFVFQLDNHVNQLDRGQHLNWSHIPVTGLLQFLIIISTHKSSSQDYLTFIHAMTIDDCDVLFNCLSFRSLQSWDTPAFRQRRPLVNHVAISMATVQINNSLFISGVWKILCNIIHHRCDDK